MSARIAADECASSVAFERHWTVPHRSARPHGQVLRDRLRHANGHRIVKALRDERDLVEHASHGARLSRTGSGSSSSGRVCSSYARATPVSRRKSRADSQRASASDGSDSKTPTTSSSSA
jgi:hypothetical protein